jgi:hypothetical protein
LVQERAIKALELVHWLNASPTGNDEIGSLVQLQATVLAAVGGQEAAVMSEFKLLLSRVDSAWSLLVGRPLLTNNGAFIAPPADEVLTVGFLELDCFERLGFGPELTAPLRKRALVWKNHSRQLEYACHVYQAIVSSLNSIPPTMETEQLAKLKVLVRSGLHEETWGPHGGNAE